MEGDWIKRDGESGRTKMDGEGDNIPSRIWRRPSNLELDSPMLANEFVSSSLSSSPFPSTAGATRHFSGDDNSVLHMGHFCCVRMTVSIQFWQKRCLQIVILADSAERRSMQTCREPLPRRRWGGLLFFSWKERGLWERGKGRGRGFGDRGIPDSLLGRRWRGK
jgi:hypothetical protein